MACLNWPPPLFTALLGIGAATTLGASLSGQARPAYVGMLDEHPAIQYAVRPTTDRIVKLNDALARGERSLQRDERTGYLLALLDSLGLPVESQLLVFSKTGVQRGYTGPRNPRALYFDESVVVGYIPGAPMIEIAAHDPQQGVVFYTLDQAADPPAFHRQTNCLTCHVSTTTLDIPGLIDRSNMVDREGGVMPQLGNFAVSHRTEHTQRWGGWFVTKNISTAQYAQLGHLGNVTVTVHPTSGPAIISDHVFIEWLDSAPEARGYPSAGSDIAALLAFDHQSYAINLITRLNWEARVADASGGSGADTDSVVAELADYLLFVDEAPIVVEITPLSGFAERLLARTPKDRLGRSFGELELTTRLLRYPCSYMVYTEAFDALATPVKGAVYKRMLTILTGTDEDARYSHLSDDDRGAILDILRDTKPDFPRP